jgi:hypothetical protein
MCVYCVLVYLWSVLQSMVLVLSLSSSFLLFFHLSFFIALAILIVLILIAAFHFFGSFMSVQPIRSYLYFIHTLTLFLLAISHIHKHPKPSTQTPHHSHPFSPFSLSQRLVPAACRAFIRHTTTLSTLNV